MSGEIFIGNIAQIFWSTCTGEKLQNEVDRVRVEHKRTNSDY